jgi:ferredoxin
MPTFTLDGQEIPFEPGETIIAAARRAGINIPHYCWHPDLSIAGNCRMCLVEVEGWPKLQIACNTMPNEGMVVKADSDWAVNARQAVMEFLLINHPLDCPICDQAGECKLQDYAVEHGRGYSRFDEHKVEKRKKVEFSDRVVYDGERCILCTRCVRFCAEVAGKDELSVANRGDQNEIVVTPGKQLENDYSMNVIDICPVGALTSKDFRFRSRIWFMGLHPQRLPDLLPRLQHRGRLARERDPAPRPRREPGREPPLDVRRGTPHLRLRPREASRRPARRRRGHGLGGGSRGRPLPARERARSGRVGVRARLGPAHERGALARAPSAGRRPRHDEPRHRQALRRGRRPPAPAREEPERRRREARRHRPGRREPRTRRPPRRHRGRPREDARGHRRGSGRDPGARRGSRQARVARPDPSAGRARRRPTSSCPAARPSRRRGPS